MTAPHPEEIIKSRARIMEIARLRLHDDIIDEVLNEYVQKAAKEFDLPISLVSIVLDDAQKFAAAHGLAGWMAETNGTPVEWSFCAHSLGSKAPFIVEDTHLHKVLKDNPLVTIDKIRCYAGVPLISKNNQIVGNFCVIGDESRSFSEAEVNRLKEYATLAMQRIEERIAEA